jgi:hypothetical protein
MAPFAKSLTDESGPRCPTTTLRKSIRIFIFQLSGGGTKPPPLCKRSRKHADTRSPIPKAPKTYFQYDRMPILYLSLNMAAIPVATTTSRLAPTVWKIDFRTTPA